MSMSTDGLRPDDRRPDDLRPDSLRTDGLRTDGLRTDGLWTAGRWGPGRHGVAAHSVNPATGEAVGPVAQGGPDDVDDAIAGARGAMRSWSGVSPFERADVLDAVATAVAAQREPLARILSEDQGKPLVAEAYDEVQELVVYLTMAAADARRSTGSLPASTSRDRRVLVQRVPLGVIGVISPWNWPFTMAAELFAPALAAGNTVVWIPAPTTTACSVALGRVIDEALQGAGAPAGVLSLVPGPGPVVGRALSGHPGVDGIGFVGSIATGRDVAARSAGKAQILELGGNGPFVVLDDADLDAAVAATIDAAFLCAGQSCTAGERWLVARSVHKEFVERLEAAIAGSVRLGNPLDPRTTMGPLNNEAVAARAQGHVEAAIAGGAHRVLGGRRESGWPTDLYFEPTLLDGVAPDALIAVEETFGPVVPVVEIASEAEALEMIESSPYGLTAAVWTGDLARGLRFAEAARTGWVNINGSTNLWESHLPFGGRAGSSSGSGRVGGSAPIERFSEPRTITFPLPAAPLRSSPPDDGVR